MNTLLISSDVQTKKRTPNYASKEIIAGLTLHFNDLLIKFTEREAFIRELENKSSVSPIVPNKAEQLVHTLINATPAKRDAITELNDDANAWITCLEEALRGQRNRLHYYLMQT